MHELTARRLLARTARAQRDGRLPSLAVGVWHDGATWTAGRGRVDDGEPTSDTQYRIGSITKTFVAVLVLQLRDEGRLHLDDPAEEHLGAGALGGVGGRTVGHLLSHTAGLQAETDGDWWERSAGRPWEEVADEAARPARPPREGGAFHYSNVGYAALGRIVERLRGAPWHEALTQHVLAPLELRRTTADPVPPHARGLAVHPWADVVLPEPAPATAGMGPAGQLWSTAGDLARWGAFLLGDTADVLDASTLEEMAQPRAVADAAAPGAAYGLGVMVVRRSDRTLVGHGGSMPGFVAGLWADRRERSAAVALSNATAGLDGTLCADLLDILAEQEPHVGASWSPAEPDEDPALDLVGVWYWGPTAMGLRSTAGGGLELRALGGPGRGARLVPDGPDRWRGLDGYYAGESLRVVRDAGGRAVRLDLASFVLTREPYAPAEAIPGGVDPSGWRGVSAADAPRRTGSPGGSGAPSSPS